MSGSKRRASSVWHNLPDILDLPLHGLPQINVTMPGGLPLNRYLVEVTIPDDLWSNAKTTTSVSMPVGWDAEPAGRTSIQFGTNWLRSGTSALLVVPSAIVPEEFNILINPQHSGSARITATKVRRWLYDPRLTKTA